MIIMGRPVVVCSETCPIHSVRNEVTVVHLSTSSRGM